MSNNYAEYYHILGLKPGASKAEIRNAYRELIKVWHPDRFPNDPALQRKATEKLKEINDAYERLQTCETFFHRFRASRSSPSTNTIGPDIINKVLALVFASGIISAIIKNLMKTKPITPPPITVVNPKARTVVVMSDAELGAEAFNFMSAYFDSMVYLQKAELVNEQAVTLKYLNPMDNATRQMVAYNRFKSYIKDASACLGPFLHSKGPFIADTTELTLTIFTWLNQEEEKQIKLTSSAFSQQDASKIDLGKYMEQVAANTAEQRSAWEHFSELAPMTTYPLLRHILLSEVNE